MTPAQVTALAAKVGQTAAEILAKTITDRNPDPEQRAKAEADLLAAYGAVVEEAPAPPAPVTLPAEVEAILAGRTTAPAEPPVETKAETPARPARKAIRKMSAEVRQAMPALAARLYEWAEKSVEYNGKFTCVRAEVARALGVRNPRRIGYAIKLHRDAGVWRVARHGRWSNGKARRPDARTVYQLLPRFDHDKAVEVYGQAKAKQAEKCTKLAARRRPGGSA